MKGKNEHKSENVFSTEKTLLERIEEVREKNPVSATISYNMMGINEFNQGNLELALENYMNVIDVSGDLERPKYIAALNIASIYGRLGNIHRKMEFVKTAYEYFKKNSAGINRIPRLNSIGQYIE